jgi:hypothetical protein
MLFAHYNGGDANKNGSGQDKKLNGAFTSRRRPAQHPPEQQKRSLLQRFLLPLPRLSHLSTVQDMASATASTPVPISTEPSSGKRDREPEEMPEELQQKEQPSKLAFTVMQVDRGRHICITLAAPAGHSTKRARQLHPQRRTIHPLVPCWQVAERINLKLMTATTTTTTTILAILCPTRCSR